MHTTVITCFVILVMTFVLDLFISSFEKICFFSNDIFLGGTDLEMNQEDFKAHSYSVRQ